MPDFTLQWVYQLDDFNTAGALDAVPNEQGARAQGSPPWQIQLDAAASPLQITVSDDDPNFNEIGDPGQVLASDVTIDGVTYLAGARVVINYVITTDDGFEGYSITLGSNNTGNNTTTAFITNTPLVPGQTYEFTSEGNIGNSNNFGFDDFACFAAGTLISTINGNRLVEHIKVGDLVTTRDYGDLAVTWIGIRTVPGVGKMAPILFRSGAFSVTKDLIVSPNHRMLFSGYEAELLFGEQEILVPAKALVNDNTILRVETGMVTYVHLMFEDHQIICANGAWSESFFAGQEALGNMDDEQLQEFYELFPEKRNCTAMRPARPIAKSFEGKLLS